MPRPPARTTDASRAVAARVGQQQQQQHQQQREQQQQQQQQQQQDDEFHDALDSDDVDSSRGLLGLHIKGRDTGEAGGSSGPTAAVRAASAAPAGGGVSHESGRRSNAVSQSRSSSTFASQGNRHGEGEEDVDDDDSELGLFVHARSGIPLQSTHLPSEASDEDEGEEGSLLAGGRHESVLGILQTAWSKTRAEASWPRHQEFAEFADDCKRLWTVFLRHLLVAKRDLDLHLLGYQWYAALRTRIDLHSTAFRVAVGTLLLCLLGAVVLWVCLTRPPFYSAYEWEQRHWDASALAGQWPGQHSSSNSAGSGSGSVQVQTEEGYPGFDVRAAAALWQEKVGCAVFRRKHRRVIAAYSQPSFPHSASLQDPGKHHCSRLRLPHVRIFLSADMRSWVAPHKVDGFFHCPRCSITCEVTFAKSMAENADAHAWVWPRIPDTHRNVGDPLRIYINMEAKDMPQTEHRDWYDILVDFRASSDVQLTYADVSHTFDAGRNDERSTVKRQDVPLFHASSNCQVDWRERLGGEVMERVASHRFGVCHNNVNGTGQELLMYPHCSHPWVEHKKEAANTCAMSHYKFALFVENNVLNGYVTEKALDPLDAGTVPVYYGAPDIDAFMPPESFINAFKLHGPDDVARRINELNEDPVLYMNHLAWRMCGVYGPLAHVHALGFESLPCRLCEAVSAMGGRLHQPS